MQTEIVLPETKPETEWVNGRALQKVSPTYRHSRLQSQFWVALNDWAEDRGRVGIEWRFRIAPPGESIRPLVPDVAYLSYDRLGAAEEDAAQIPLATPNIAVDILSRDDRPRDVRHKVETYLRAGAEAVIVVDPKTETIRAESLDGVVTWSIGDVLVHVALPDFMLDVAAYFASAKR